jgi:glycosyltransferase involved in cell wall biosynthesis
MKILIVTFTGGTGGITVLLRNILEKLKHDPRFTFEVCFTQQLGVVAEEIRDMGLPVHFLGMRNGFDLLKAVRLIPLIRKGKFDLVNFHGQIPIVRLMMALSHASVILEEHGGIKEEAQKRRVLNPCLHRILDHWTKAYVTVSDDSIEDLKRVHWVDPRKITKIYNGIDLKIFNAERFQRNELREKLGIPLDSIVFGTVRSLTTKMGIDHFIHAASIIGSRHADAYFVIVGDGPLRASLEDMASKSPVGQRILFTGSRRDIPLILRGLDIFVLPSVWEALPIAAIESIAMGVPVVSYDVGGTREVVVDGQTGLLVQERNYEALAEHMDLLYCDHNLRARLGRCGIERANACFDIEKIAAEFGEYYYRYFNPN